MLLGACHAAAAEVVVGVGQLADAFVVDATVEAPVALKTAWEVMIDFGHMTSILNNLTSSKIVSREGNTLIVKQEGVAKYGLFSYAFQSEREIRLEPMSRILAKNRSGTAKRMESEARFNPSAQGVRINYHAEIVPDSVLARMFGATFVHHEIEEQFQLMLAEMKRREKSQKSGTSPEAGF
jgi:hypothetical protein